MIGGNSHQWIPSTLGHGETMCARCYVTNREAAALGILNRCDAPTPSPKATNDNKSVFTQEQIDAELSEVDETFDDSDSDNSDECGRRNNGSLTQQCRLAGAEWCDWDCPIGFYRRPATKPPVAMEW